PIYALVQCQLSGNLYNHSFGLYLLSFKYVADGLSISVWLNFLPTPLLPKVAKIQNSNCCWKILSPPFPFVPLGIVNRLRTLKPYFLNAKIKSADVSEIGRASCREGR